MKPFSSRYFLLHNRAKAVCIIFMISMLSVAYVGGLYLTNISEEAFAITKEIKDFVFINNTISDTDGKQLKALLHELQSEGSIEIYQTGANHYHYKTILGFISGNTAYSFTKEDFKRFNKKMHLVPEEEYIAENSVLLSKREASFLNVKDGDMLHAGDTDYIKAYWGKGPFEVKTYDRNVLNAYFVIDDVSASSCYLLTWKEAEKEKDFYSKINALAASYDKIEFMTNEDRVSNYEQSFEIINLIYYSIISILTIVFAITINAVFVSMYDKRKQEFLIYQGIGMGTFRICKKIIAEILILNGLGLLLGSVISISVVSSLNQFVYSKDGIRMWYYHKTAFIAVVLCNLAILIPGIGLRIHGVRKDVKNALY